MKSINKYNIKKFTFEEFVKVINTKDILNEFEDKVNNLTVNPRIMLLAYTIYQFNSEIFYKSDELLELLIKYKSEKLIDLYECDINNSEFIIEYNDFNEKFNEWKQIDAKKLTNFFKNSLTDLDIYKSMNFKDDIKYQINSKQEFIKKRLEIIIDKYNLQEINTDESIEVENIIEKAFWNLFTESLVRFESNTLNEQDIQWIINLLIEIRDLMNNLTPNNQTFVNETNENFDIQFIEQRIRNNSMDNKYLNQLLFFIMDRICSLQAAIDDFSTKRWIYLTKEILKYNCHYYDLLPIYFKIIYTKLKKIHEQLK